MEVCIIAFSWTAFSMYLYRLYASFELVDKLKLIKAEKEEIHSLYLNLQYIAYCNELLKNFMALCAGLATIRFIKLLRFNKKIIVFLQAFVYSVKELLSVGICFGIIWIAFVQCIYVIFNDKSPQFSSFLTTMETCFQIILGKFDVKPMTNSNAVFGPLIYVLYNILIIFILINIILSVLTEHYSKAKLSNDLEKQDPDLFNYIKMKIELFFKQNSKNELNSEPMYHDAFSSMSLKVDLIIKQINKRLQRIY